MRHRVVVVTLTLPVPEGTVVDEDAALDWQLRRLERVLVAFGSPGQVHLTVAGPFDAPAVLQQRSMRS